MARWNNANILETSAGGRHLWQLSANGNGFTFEKQTTMALSEAPPSGAVEKDWHTLFRRKLNVALLPVDKVFLRAVQLPSSDPAEIAAMVELQLEKLSPLPVTHIVWSLYTLPKQTETPETLQTVLVIIALRSVVEEFLGELEGQGFLTDRLEAPGLDQLLATKIEDDGVWIYPGIAGEPVLIAWWYGKVLQNLTLLALQFGPERGASLKTQIEQIAWAGELEGWLTAPPKIHLVATGEEARFWEAALADCAEGGVKVIAPVPAQQLAAISATRCSSEGSTTNLMPPEFSTRYQQQFVDGLWMRGLFTIVGIYLVGVVAYFAALFILQHKHDQVVAQLKGISGNYTNAMRDEAQIQILKDRQELKYAALDCWKAVAENLPDSVTLEDMYFQRGRLELRGTGLADQQEDVTAFNEGLRKAVDLTQNDYLFSDVGPPTLNIRNNLVDWKFNCTLRNTETQ